MIAPIAIRELLVASRQPVNWRVRLAMTLIALIICSFALTSTASPNAGRNAFNILANLAFIYTLCAGFVFTAGCISDERREGTFGLLYLTPLSSWNVIAGKLASSSLQAFFGLIAIIPVLSLSLLAGGVTGQQVTRVVLTLVATLLFSLAAGIFASASAKNTRGALGLTALLVLAPVVGAWIGLMLAPILAFAGEEKKMRANVYWGIGFGALLGLHLWNVIANGTHFSGSPAQTFMSAMIPGTTNANFMASSIAILATAFFYLFSATLCTEWYREAREIVIEKEEAEGHIEDVFFPGLRSKGRVGDDPARWLLSFLQSPPMLFYVSVALLLLSNLARGNAPAVASMHMFSIVAGFIPFLLFNFAVARYCAAPFSMLERSGFSETLLTTPLRNQDLVRAQRRSLWRTMRLPFIFLVLAATPLMIRTLLFWFERQSQFSGPPLPYIIQWVIGWVLFAMNIEAISLVAMRHGIAGKKPLNAGLRAVALVVLPQLIMNFIFFPLTWMLNWQRLNDLSSIVIIQMIPHAFAFVFLLAILRSAKRNLHLRPNFLNP